MLFGDPLSLHLVTFLMFFILVIYRLIELVSAMNRIQKQNYYQSFPLHIIIFHPAAASRSISICLLLFSRWAGCSFKLDGKVSSLFTTLELDNSKPMDALSNLMGEDIFPSSLKEHPSASYCLVLNRIMVSRWMLFDGMMAHNYVLEYSSRSTTYSRST